MLGYSSRIAALEQSKIFFRPEVPHNRATGGTDVMKIYGHRHCPRPRLNRHTVLVPSFSGFIYRAKSSAYLSAEPESEPILINRNDPVFVSIPVLCIDVGKIVAGQ